MNTKTSSKAAEDQVLAATVLTLNLIRERACQALVSKTEDATSMAMAYYEVVRGFLAKPENILGSLDTKHGEVAESIAVADRNVDRIMEFLKPDAKLHPDRIGPIDYIIGDVNIQSKFNNGTTNSLLKLREHLEKYPDFVNDNGKYVIPKDQFEIIDRVLSGDVEGMHSKTVSAIKGHIEALEHQSGQPFGSTVESATVDYADVQLGKAHATLDRKEAELENRAEKKIDEIKKDHGPSLNEGFKAAGIAAATAGGFTLVAKLHEKHKAGRNVFKMELTAADWKDIGIDVGKSAAVGGVAGGAIYGLTNYAQVGAPLAGAMVSVCKGITPLVQGYHAGEIELEELVDAGMLMTSQVGMVSAASLVGQALIPVPLLGAFLGSMAGKVLSDMLEEHVAESKRIIELRISQYREKLDEEHQVKLQGYMMKFSAIGSMTEAAFDVESNEQVIKASAQLAVAYGVDEKKLLHSSEDFIAFMAS